MKEYLGKCQHAGWKCWDIIKEKDEHCCSFADVFRFDVSLKGHYTRDENHPLALVRMSSLLLVHKGSE
jgi:hypothetical protein